MITCLSWSPASAQTPCRAQINSTEILIEAGALDAAPGEAGLRERVARWPSRGLDRLRGRLPTCDSATLIAFLSHEVPEGDIEGYCLSPDPMLGYLLAPGARDYRGRCIRTACDRVKDTGGSARAMGTRVTDIATGRRENQSRAQATIHASGAAIVTGSAGSILAALGSGVSTVVAGALAAPAVAGAAAVSVVTVGGAVYLCSDAG